VLAGTASATEWGADYTPVMRSLEAISGFGSVEARNTELQVGRDLMGALLVRTEEIGADISAISRLFRECSLQPISTDQSG
jgi:hypothetical protein